MALASANVPVPTTELILQKLQYLKIAFSLEIMTFATFRTTSKSSTAYHPSQLHMLKIMRFRAGNGPITFNVKLTNHQI